MISGELMLTENDGSTCKHLYPSAVSWTTQLILCIYFAVKDGLKLAPCFEETCIFRCASQTLSGNQRAVRGWLSWGFLHLEENGGERSAVSSHIAGTKLMMFAVVVLGSQGSKLIC